MNRLTILCYHRVSEDTRSNSFYTSGLLTAQFYEQMVHVRKNYEVLPLEEALSLLNAGTLPGKTVSITFDDGYRELMDGAFHILRDLHLPATVFLVAGHVGTDLPFWWEEVAFRLKQLNKRVLTEFLRTNDLQISAGRSDWIHKIIDALKGISANLRDKCVGNLRELTGEICLPRMSLTWEEARIAQSWGISFGSHSMTHPILTRLDDEALKQEIQLSRDVIESMTGGCHLLAYPNGDHDDRVRAAVQRAGYRWAVTMERGRNEAGTNPLALRRHPVYAHYSVPLFAAILRGWLDLPPWVLRLVNDVRDHKIWLSMSPNRMI